MSVVSTDWRDPASWCKVRIAYGVVNDGDTLRFCRASKTGKNRCFQCSISEWKEQPEFRKRFAKDRASGALLVCGLEPHRVMLRSLESPFKDKDKTDEIWGTLLDAVIPFSLEKCQVTFLPSPSGDSEGLRCLAVAARAEDLEDVLQEWAELGMHPDIIMPEELMLPADLERPLWLGHTRTVFCTWKDGVFTGGGGALKPEMRDKQLARFVQSHSADKAPLAWKECGPGADSRPEVLETALATAALKPNPRHANLRSDALAAAGLQTSYDKKFRTLKLSFMVLLLLFVLFPLTLRHQLRAHQNLLQSQIATLYRSFTGSAGNAPRQQELLLARRYQDEKWGGLWQTVETISRPVVSLQLTELLLAARNTEVVYTHLDLQAQSLKLQVLGREEQVNDLVVYLTGSGWVLQSRPGADGIWHLSGERTR